MPSANRISYRCFLLGYVITLNCLTHNYRGKHWLISMPEMFPWSRISYKFMSQNFSGYKPFSFYAKEHKVLCQWFFELIQNILNTCNDIYEVNLSHMHWMLLALALLQHSHKKLTDNHDILPALFTIKRVLRWNYPRSISLAKLFALHLLNPYSAVK